jgi:hypothetical protein
MIPVWSTLAGFQALVVWQLSQANVVTMWVGPLPFLAKMPLPLWQVSQTVMLVCVCSNLTMGFHLPGALLWQASQALLVVKPVKCLPAMMLTLGKPGAPWQLAQLPLKLVWSTLAGFHPTTVWQVLQGWIAGTCVVGFWPLVASLPVPS